MDFLLAVALFLAGLIVSIVKGVSIIAPLVFGFVCFATCAVYRGFPLSDVLRMAMRGMKKPLIVIRILVLIGMLTAVWRAAGTIPFLVYYGIKIIDPRFFIIYAFLLSCVVGYALGTCLGTAGTIGVFLMVLARSGGADPTITAGAILSGAFFGDRCAPTSSSANLVAALTDTRLYDNIRNMFKTAFLPTLLSFLIYLIVSLRCPMRAGDPAVLSEISGMFDLNPITALPVLLILILPLAGLDVRPAMLLSILSGVAVALWVQDMTVAGMARTLLTGYAPEDTGRFARILAGGGLFSMIRTMGIVLIASTYSGIFEETNLLSGIRGFLERACRRIALYPTMLITSFVTNGVACNQTLGVILAHQLMNGIYKEHSALRGTLAIDIENTAILTSGLLPWNTAAAVPMVMLAVDARAIPWAVFLWLVPLVNLFPALRADVKPG